MKIVFDDKAISDLQAIREWIERHSATSAEKVLKRIFSAISVLDRFPKRGQLGRHPKTHELIIAGLPYLVVYQLMKLRCNRGDSCRAHGSGSLKHQSLK